MQTNCPAVKYIQWEWEEKKECLSVFCECSCQTHELGGGSIPRNTAWALLRLHLAWCNCLKLTTGSGARLPQTVINSVSRGKWYQLQIDSITSCIQPYGSYGQAVVSIWSGTACAWQEVPLKNMPNIRNCPVSYAPKWMTSCVIDELHLKHLEKQNLCFIILFHLFPKLLSHLSSWVETGRQWVTCIEVAQRKYEGRPQ